MSIANPLVVDFTVNAADQELPIIKEFTVAPLEQDVFPFSLTHEYNPIVQARTYVHEQSPASDTWVINHNLKKYPSVTIVDSAGRVVIGEVQYIDNTLIICSFSAPFSGIAYLN